MVKEGQDWMGSQLQSVGPSQFTVASCGQELRPKSRGGEGSSSALWNAKLNGVISMVSKLLYSAHAWAGVSGKYI